MKGIPSIGEYESLSHPKWECKYRVVSIPKCRRKALLIRQPLGEVFTTLTAQKEIDRRRGICSGAMLISSPPKYRGAVVRDSDRSAGS
jgi:putative transposase